MASRDPEGYLWPIPHDQVKQRITKLSASAPRFLFRAWKHSSGGGKSNSRYVYNEVKIIRPRAFADASAPGPDSIHDIPRGTLAEICYDHLHGRQDRLQPTVFSSWSHNLQTCLSFCRQRRYTHISVVDVKRLPERNVVLYTPDLESILAKGIPKDFVDEFLIFGVIEGHEVLSCTDYFSIKNAGLEDLLALNGGRAWPSYLPLGHEDLRLAGPGDIDGHLDYPDDAPECALIRWDRGRTRKAFPHYLAIALQIGRLYSDEFVLPVAIAFVCLAPFTVDVQKPFPVPAPIAPLMQRIPVDWLEDWDTTDPRFKPEKWYLDGPCLMSLYLLRIITRLAHQAYGLLVELEITNGPVGESSNGQEPG